MNCDSFLAMELEYVVDLFRKAGIEIDIQYTAPPKGEQGGAFRVVRCRKTADKVFLLVAREVLGKEV